ncbi:family 16 glycosylhydrolase [Ancylomarina sp. 16SWW S1-10-2]|uniref:family 16 glycosylhydrolase n=1 Tax=Ancylomarina sp. 16SWW S1-10-2 TaxID=2499681 RepID=UPI0012AD4EA6|nr:family 16 glycosylhydrolase [Ancylomarina sp. 16SWW S1-10-2]MRT92093.1 glycosyl hydrolase family protein [Ancylomarina sp. 16SWW S1-10-2]
MKIFHTFTKILLSILIVSTLLSCSKSDDDEDSYTPDFAYVEDVNDANKIIFSNTSTGDYLFMQWDFGNGVVSEKERTNTKDYTVFYSEKGDYQVQLTLWGLDNVLSNNKVVTKTVSIQNDVFVADFTYTIDNTRPNFVTLNNTTTGDYDRISWKYNDLEITGDNINEYEIYLHKAGIYNIELHVYKGDFEKILTKNITITQDDPDYLDNMSLVWADEFDGTSVNIDNWTFETGANGWGNNELQNYTNGDNAEIIDGKLIITAKKVNDNKAARSYTSTRMISKGKQSFTYGRMEIRAKLPSGKGIWPAIWMLGENISTVSWPACGEIDIMEYVGYEPDKVHATVHTTSGSGSNGSGSSKTLETAEEAFHIYGLLWDEDELNFYIDTPDNITHTYAPSVKTEANWPFDKPQFFILNVAVGGDWGGAQGIDNSIFPQTMEVDYVRVYQ